MDRLFSLFSVYDFFGYVLAGGVLLAGTYWAFARLPEEPGASAVLGIVALSYMAGHAVQAVATVWEGAVWKRTGMPSANRMSDASTETSTAYEAALQALIRERVEHITGKAGLSAQTMFAIARAELRRRSSDSRAELMNTMYGLCRGVATAMGLLVPVLVAAAFSTGDWKRLAIAIAVATASAALFARRAHRYSYRFADQVWHDFAALSPSAK